jgi:hypothetical protein
VSGAASPVEAMPLQIANCECEIGGVVNYAVWGQES